MRNKRCDDWMTWSESAIQNSYIRGVYPSGEQLLQWRIRFLDLCPDNLSSSQQVKEMTFVASVWKSGRYLWCHAQHFKVGFLTGILNFLENKVSWDALILRDILGNPLEVHHLNCLTNALSLIFENIQIQSLGSNYREILNSERFWPYYSRINCSVLY